MSAYPHLVRIPDVVFVGQIGDSYATAETDEGVGLLVFLDSACHERSLLPEALKGTDPVAMSRETVMSLCDVCYLVDPDADAYLSFVITDEVAR